MLVVLFCIVGNAELLEATASTLVDPGHGFRNASWLCNKSSLTVGCFREMPPDSAFSTGWHQWVKGARRKLLTVFVGASLMALLTVLVIVLRPCPQSITLDMKSAEVVKMDVPRPLASVSLSIIAITGFIIGANVCAVKMGMAVSSGAEVVGGVHVDIELIQNHMISISDLTIKVETEMRGLFDSCEGLAFIFSTPLLEPVHDDYEAHVVNQIVPILDGIRNLTDSVNDALQPILNDSDQLLRSTREYELHVQLVVILPMVIIAAVLLLLAGVLVMPWRTERHHVKISDRSSRRFFILPILFLVLPGIILILVLTMSMDFGTFALCGSIDGTLVDMATDLDEYVPVVPLLPNVYCSPNLTVNLGKTARAYPHYCGAMAAAKAVCGAQYTWNTESSNCSCIQAGHICDNHTSTNGTSLYIRNLSQTAKKVPMCAAVSQIFFEASQVGLGFDEPTCNALMTTFQNMPEISNYTSYYVLGKGENPISHALVVEGLDIQKLLPKVHYMLKLIRDPVTLAGLMCPAIQRLDIETELGNIIQAINDLVRLAESENIRGYYTGAVHEAMCFHFIGALRGLYISSLVGAFLIFPLVVMRADWFFKNIENYHAKVEDYEKEQSESWLAFEDALDTRDSSKISELAELLSPRINQPLPKHGETPLVKAMNANVSKDDIKKLLDLRANVSQDTIELSITSGNTEFLYAVSHGHNVTPLQHARAWMISAGEGGCRSPRSQKG